MPEPRRPSPVPTPGPSPVPSPATPAVGPSSSISAESAGAGGGSLRDTIEARELFWHNVVREMLTSLSVAGAEDPSVFDGRFAILTNMGHRIPIAGVVPLFACGVVASQDLSMAVECTVFQVLTPTGEVFTLPLHEIRAVHALTEDLITQLAESARAQNPEHAPFGFAAFTSLARSQRAGGTVPPPAIVGPGLP